MSRKAEMRRQARQQMAPADFVPADRLADLVCHDEQMNIWVGEVLGELDEHVVPPNDQEELLILRLAVSRAIRHVVASAFAHPEILGLPSEKARK